MKKNFLKSLELIISLISIVLCLVSNPINGYNILFLIPLTYFCCRILSKYTYYDYNKNFAYLVLNFLTFLKYSIMPILIIIMEDYYGGVLTNQIPESSYVRIAIVMLIIECVNIFFIMELYRRYSMKSTTNIRITREIKINPAMIVFFLISMILIFKYMDSFLPYKFFVIDNKYTTVAIDSNVDGLIKIFFYLFKLFIMLYFIQFFIKKYKKSNNFINIIGIIVILILYLGINTSISRWSLVIPTIIIFYILRELWFKNMKNKIVMVTIILTLIISFVSISLYKFNWLFKNRDISEVTSKEVVTILASQIQEYISGPRAVAQGIQAADIYDKDINLETMINDFTGSIPFISKFVNQDDRINIYYNYLLKGTDKEATQIMPMITIGYSYFSIAFCYVFIDVCVLLSLYCGNLANNKKDLFRKYIYSYLCFWLAMCIGFNTQIIFGWFISSFVPFILVLNVNDKFTFKKNTKNKPINILN